jgi:predicted small lipoprotein YifL
MRARTLLTAALVAAALAGCGREAPTAPGETAAPGAARREVAPEPPPPTPPTPTASSEAAQAAGGYLGSGNRGDSTSIEPEG